MCAACSDAANSSPAGVVQCIMEMAMTSGRKGWGEESLSILEASRPSSGAKGKRKGEGRTYYGSVSAPAPQRSGATGLTTDGSRRIPVWGLFRFASQTEYQLMLVGSLFAIFHGISYPILALVFGQMTNTFLNVTSSRIVIPSTESVKNPEDGIFGESFTTKTSLFNSSLPGPTSMTSTGGLEEHLSAFSLYYVLLGLWVFVTAALQVYCWELACERHVHRLRHIFFSQVLRQDLEWYSSKEGGDFTTLLSDDLERVREGTGNKLSMLVQYVATLVSGLAVGLVASWRLTTVLLGVGPLLVVATGYLANVVAVASRAEQTRYSQAGSIATQALTCIRTVAAFGGQALEEQKYKKALENGIRMAMRKYLHLCVSLAAVQFFTYASYAIAFWYGSDLIGKEQASPGDILTVFFAVLAGAFSIGNSLPFIHAVSTAVGSASTVFTIIDRIPKIDPYDSSGLIPEQVRGKVEIRNVTFEYPNRPGVKVLRNFSLLIEPGKTVALVGPSGAGKSTVIALLQRFYDVEQGQVLLDGVDVQRLNLPWLRSQAGVVSQEPTLFSATIRENIHIGRDGVSSADTVHAAKTANAHEFIVELPDGYETLVGEGGNWLSGGQKQRVAIARALVRDPKLLLLDEATSALDAQSEGVVQDALDRAMWGRTTVIVAHRLSTVRNADIIHTMKDGELIESGTHEELMSRQGLYFQLATSQKAMKDAEAADTMHFDDQDDVTNSSTAEAKSEMESTIISAKPRPTGVSHFAVLGLGRALTADGKGIDHRGALHDLGRLLKLHSTEWYLLVLGFLGCVLTGSVMPTFSLFYGEVFKTFTLHGEDLYTTARFWTYMFIALAFVSAASWFMQVISLSYASEFLVVRMRIMAFRNVLHQAVGWFDLENSNPRKLAARLARDAPTVKAAAGWRVGQVIAAAVTLFESMFIALLFGWKLFLVAAVPAPFIVFSYYRQAMAVRRHQRRDQELMSNSVRVASECVSNITTVQSLGREQHFYRMYSTFLKPPFREAKRHAYVFAIVYALTQGLIYLMYAAAFKYGASLIDSQEMTPTNVYRVFFALAFCSPALGTTTSYLQDYAKARLSARLMIELIDQKPGFECGPLIGVKPEIRGKVSLRNVFFRYPSRPDVEVLRGLSLTVQPGQTLALVGASGSGKSTVVSLIERFYEPTSGFVMVDEIDIRTINLGHLRAHIGVVTQEPPLLNGSIRDNIAYGYGVDAIHVSMTEIVRAARIANIHDFIITLPQRYDTLVGDKGTEVSGGQKQRIAIARAIVRNPRVLLLDEATSALDLESEKVVQDALDRARRGRTCIVVAHRLSTVQSADCIALIHRGRIEEMGTHEDLQARRGRYYRLTQRQTL